MRPTGMVWRWYLPASATSGINLILRWDVIIAIAFSLWQFVSPYFE